MEMIIFLSIVGVIVYFFIKKQSSGINTNAPVQTRVIQYFVQKTVFPGNANYTGNVKFDTEYDELVKSQVSIDEVKGRAFEKLGLDESELTEIEPIHFENYYYGTEADIEDFLNRISIMNAQQMLLRPSKESIYRQANIIIGEGKDGKLRSSAYQVTWLFTTPKQVCIYVEIIYLHKNEIDEITRQFLWKHIASIHASRKTLKIKGKSEKFDTFCLNIAGGEHFECSMIPTDYTSRSINAMKQRLIDYS